MKRAVASRLMDPLRVALGARLSVSDAVRRLATHDTGIAPVLTNGVIAGLITRSTAEHAMRMGGSGLKLDEILCGGAPHAGGIAGPGVMKRRVMGVAPGLLVTGSKGLVMGLIPRRRIDVIVDAGSQGQDLRARIRRLMGRQGELLLRCAGALATRTGVRLHLAGGVVRDLLMGRRAKDIDLVVEGDGIAFATRLAEELGGTLTGHDRFGTAVIRLKPAAGDESLWQRIDVATARHEQYAHPAALPSVVPGTIDDDRYRRDVTINSMMIRLDGRRFGRLVDTLGGQRDLRRRVLQVHHVMSLADDPTRAFRIARFAARFGFTQTEETRRSLRLARRLGAFEQLGGERLYRELALIASEPEPWRALRLCASSGLFRDVGPALRWESATRYDMERFFTGIRQGRLGASGLAVDSGLLMLMLLTRGAPRSQRRMLAHRLKLAGRPAARLDRFVKSCRKLCLALSRHQDAAAVTRLCEGAEPEILALVWSAGGPPAHAVDWYLRALRLVRPTLTGKTLREMGLDPGPALGAVLTRLRTAILDGQIQTADDERAMALRLVRRSRRQR